MRARPQTAAPQRGGRERCAAPCVCICMHTSGGASLSSSRCSAHHSHHPPFETNSSVFPPQFKRPIFKKAVEQVAMQQHGPDTIQDQTKGLSTERRPFAVLNQNFKILNPSYLLTRSTDFNNSNSSRILKACSTTSKK